MKAAMDAQSTPRTFCLSAGTYTVNQTIRVEGDTVIGAGRDATFLDLRGLDPNRSQGFYVRGSQGMAMFRDLEVFGTPVPSTLGTCQNQTGVIGNSGCGKAFVSFGDGLQLLRVDCRDNGGNCVGGSGNLVLDSIDCWNNGSAYSMTSSFRYAACVKQAAAYSLGANNVVVRNSYIHDNPWVGLWCDFCKFGKWDIHDNAIDRNGARGIQWEMSGGWSADDSAWVHGNTFSGNGWRISDPSGATTCCKAAVHISTANDILVEGNTFAGDNITHGVSVIFTGSRNPPQPDSRGVVIRNNTMNGDTISGCTLAGVSCSGNA